jgi:cell pole-organizing protein PopZ|tara:strand:+ start:300 stop:545 length:246 start_codon:yes stop_codon:yes gene_type:complete
MKKQSKEILSKKTATALKAELSKYSDIFNVKETQELVQEVVSSVTEKTLTDWINTNMDSVVKKSVKEELAKIAKNKTSAKK